MLRCLKNSALSLVASTSSWAEQKNFSSESALIEGGERDLALASFVTVNTPARCGCQTAEETFLMWLPLTNIS